MGFFKTLGRTFDIGSDDDQAKTPDIPKPSYGSNGAANAAGLGYRQAGNAQQSNMISQGGYANTAMQNLGTQADTAMIGVAGGQNAQAGAYQQGAQAAYGQQQGARDAGMGSIARLRAMSEQGPGPSVAEAQYKQAADTSMAQQLALARSGRGAGGNAAAMRQAQFQNAATGTQLAGQAATARMQEQDTWRGRQQQYMGMEQQGLQNVRAGDVGVAGQQQQAGMGYAALGQQARTTGQQLAQGYYTQGAQLNQAYQGMGQQAQQYGMGLQNQVVTSQLGADTSSYGAQMGAGTQANLQNAAQASKDNAGIFGAVGTALSSDREAKADAHERGMADAFAAMGTSPMDPATGARGTAPIAPHAVSSGGGGGGGEAVGAIVKAAGGSGGEQGASSADAAGASGAAADYSPDVEGRAQFLSDVEQPNAGGAATDWNTIDSQGASMANQYGQTYMDPGSAQKANYGAITPQAASTGKGAGKGVGVVATILKALSDERVKEKVRAESMAAGFKLGAAAQSSDAPGAGLDRLRALAGPPSVDLRPAQGYSYDYKDPNAPGAAPGRHYGPMAQDLEKSPATASTVLDTPQGKMVDTGRLAMVNASATGEQQRRMDMLQTEIDRLRALRTGRAA